MNANQILQSDILDILFDGKNKSYGAYNLRKTYNRRVTTALMFTMGAIVVFLIGLFISGKMKKESVPVHVNNHETTVTEFKPDLPKPLPRPQLTKPAHVATVKFNIPVIIKDKLVTEPPPDLKQIENAQIDSKNTDGLNITGIVNPPSGIVGTGVVADPPNNKTSEEDGTFRKVEIEAMFPGGPQAWQRYVQKAIMARLDEFAESDYGTCIVQFIVDKNGNVSNVQATTMQGSKLAEIAVNAIKKGSKWIPAIQNGRYVNAYRVQPVTLNNPD